MRTVFFESTERSVDANVCDLLLEMTAVMPVPVAVMGEAVAQAKDDTECEKDCENCVFHELVLSWTRMERKSAKRRSVINFQHHLSLR